MRIGFVGEVGYEIHCPAAHGEHLWDAILEAGAARRSPVRPRAPAHPALQKMHILVGQDTDSEATPYSAAMPWIVKLDKEEDFIGRWALEHYGEQPAETALVGFTLPDGHVPTEGAAVLAGNGDAAGRVTSSRFSPQLGKVIGMAWVPAALVFPVAKRFRHRIMWWDWLAAALAIAVVVYAIAGRRRLHRPQHLARRPGTSPSASR